MIKKISVRARANSGKQEIVEFGDYKYLVYLKEPAENNRANIELLNLIAKHFGVPAMKIKIISGLSSDNKLLEINY